MKVLTVSMSPSEAKEEKALDGVICRLRPEWTKEEILSKDLVGGLLNAMVCFHLASDELQKDAVVLRVYQDKGVSQILKCNELHAMQLAHRSGCFPQILATLPNGLVYEYIRGRNITLTDLQDDKVIRPLSRAMADLHNVEFKDATVINKDGTEGNYAECDLFTVLKYSVGLLPEHMDNPAYEERFQALKMTTKELEDELNYLDEYYSELQLPVAFSHVDLHQMNVVFDDETEKCSFVDYEFSRPAPRMFDMFSLLADRMYTEMNPDNMDVHLLEVVMDKRNKDAKRMDEKIFRKFFAEYAQRTMELQGRKVNSDLLLYETDLIEAEYNATMPIGMFTWYLTGLACLNATAEMDIIAFTEMVKAEYTQKKPQFEAYKQKYLEMKKKI